MSRTGIRSLIQCCSKKYSKSTPLTLPENLVRRESSLRTDFGTGTGTETSILIWNWDWKRSNPSPTISSPSPRVRLPSLFYDYQLATRLNIAPI